MGVLAGMGGIRTNCESRLRTIAPSSLCSKERFPILFPCSSQY